LIKRLSPFYDHVQLSDRGLAGLNSGEESIMNVNLDKPSEKFIQPETYDD